MNEIVIGIVVVVILLLVLAILFIFTVRRVNVLVRKNFIDKLQEYDFLIEDKEKKIEELNTDLESKRKDEEEIVNKIKRLEVLREEMQPEEVDVLIPRGGDYKDVKMLEKYKKIRKSFNFSYENKIKEFLKNIKDSDETEYYVLTGIKDNLTHKVVYKISTYSPEEQKIIINELLKDDIKVYVKELLDVKKFNVAKFVNELDMLIMMTDPKIYIYVSDINMNFDNLHDNIETIYDESITEGFRIKYKGKVYDYSI